jgi:hypothetical protein
VVEQAVVVEAEAVPVEPRADPAAMAVQVKLDLPEY